MFGTNRTTFGNNNTIQSFSTGASPFGAQPSSTGSFGMNQQNNANAAGQGFGGFGMNAGTNNATTGTTGFGMNTTNNTTNSGGLFGQASNTNASATGMFGANNNAMGGMNNTTNPLLGNSMNQSTNVGSGNGTGIKPFTAYQEKDAVTNAMNVFQSITFMPEYRNFSFEELRMQDYQVGRKFANSQVPITNQTGMNTFGQTGGMNSTSTGTTGGLFGNNNTNANSAANTGGLFGQKPTTGFGANAGTGMFGNNSTNNSTMNSPFGMKTQGTTGMFGQQNNTTAGGFGQTNNTNSTGMFGMNSNTTAGSTGMFGQNNNAFGNTNNNNANTSGGLFNQSNNQQQGGLFGQKPTSGGLFGQNTSTFGNNNSTNNTNAGGMFGQNNNTAGGFGQNNNNNSMFGNNGNNTATGFGAQQNSMSGFNQNQSAGGLFGNKSAGGMFGQNNANTTNQQGGLFGNKPAGTALFGQNNNTNQQQGGLFGQNNNTAQQQGGLFGQNNNNQQQSTGGLFGQNNSQPQQQGGLFGQKPATGGLFGQNNTQQQGNVGGGLFGNNNANNNNQLGGGLFGQNNQQNQATGGGLFGAKPAATMGGGLFGNNNNQQKPAAGGLFGAKPAGTGFGGTGLNNTGASTGLFGNNNATNNTGGLFGAKPTAPLGGTAGGLFGNNNNANPTATGIGGGLFGAKPATAPQTGGLFGNNNANGLNSNSGMGTGLFANNQNQQSSLFGSKEMVGGQATQVQQQNSSLLVNNPFGSNQLFNKIAIDETGLGSARTINISKVNADVKKNNTLTGAYKLIPKPLFSTKQHIHDDENCKTSKILPGKETRAIQNNKPLISPEYGDAPKTVTASDGETKTFSFKIFNSLFNDLNFNPDKASFKSFLEEKQDKLADERKHANIRKPQKKDVEAPILKDLTKDSASSINQTTPYPVDKEKKIDSKESISTPEVKLSPPGLQGSDFSFVDEHYYISPSIDTLSSMTITGLRKVEHLIVGNTLYGKIEFLKPVDLSSLPITLLCGKYITFSKGSCKVIPYLGGSNSVGSGINVPAKITIFHCYPTDRETRKPITDPQHSVVKRHIERLRKVPNTKFEKYDPVTGDYIFKVQAPML